MELRFVQPWKSIDDAVVNDVVEDLVVLSGPNGSGKSHLLEAIQHGAIAIDGVSGGPVGQPQPGIRFFALAQLVATTEGAQAAANFRDRWIPLQQQIQSAYSALTSPGRPTRRNST
jgi:ATPase subunit of ABC transporter with duplicated ATPase domains